jgi:hypothetical protein
MPDVSCFLDKLPFRATELAALRKAIRLTNARYFVLSRQAPLRKAIRLTNARCFVLSRQAPLPGHRTRRPAQGYPPFARLCPNAELVIRALSFLWTNGYEDDWGPFMMYHL